MDIPKLMKDVTACLGYCPLLREIQCYYIPMKVADVDCLGQWFKWIQVVARADEAKLHLRLVGCDGVTRQECKGMFEGVTLDFLP